MVESEPSRWLGGDAQRPCGREVNIFEELSVKGCIGGKGPLQGWRGGRGLIRQGLNSQTQECGLQSKQRKFSKEEAGERVPGEQTVILRRSLQLRQERLQRSWLGSCRR